MCLQAPVRHSSEWGVRSEVGTTGREAAATCSGRESVAWDGQSLQFVQKSRNKDWHRKYDLKKIIANISHILKLSTKQAKHTCPVVLVWPRPWRMSLSVTRVTSLFDSRTFSCLFPQKWLAICEWCTIRPPSSPSGYDGKVLVSILKLFSFLCTSLFPKHFHWFSP